MKQSPITATRSRTKQRVSLILLIVALALFGYTWAGGTAATGTTEPTGEPAEQTQVLDFSRFLHTNPTHVRMPCLLCHRRDTNSPNISFPGKGGHTPCIGCHQDQFAAGSGGPICTICHTNAETGALKGFPGLQSFGRKFDHNRHQRVNCSVCHKTADRGVALSIPSGRTAHSTCFTCHNASQPMTMSSCNVCHQLGRLVKTSQNAAAYRINFSHSRHTQAGLNCASCHTVQGGGTGLQVTKPLASMHFAPQNKASCAACHNGQRAFGTNDFANCKRCHIGNSFKF
jgi:c(7)-type cytochrome triheme protein